MVNDSEREDFTQAINHHGLDVDDFELTEQRDQPIGTDVQPITGQVTIRRKSTGAEKTYDAGHGSSWPAEFEQDLQQGGFN